MGKSKALIGTVITALILAISALAGTTANASHVVAVDLLTTAPFAILAGTPNITNVPTSKITGDVGLKPATGAGIGLTCPEVTGTIYSVDAAGPLPCRVTNLGLLTTAKNDLTTAIGDAAGRSGGLPVVANQLAGKNLPHGVYKSAAAMDLAVGGTLTLDGGGDPSAVWIFQLGTLLTVNNNSTVKLSGGAQSCNVFWQVDSATIGTTAKFVGTILATTSITVANGSTIDGRLLASNGNVTLIADTITVSNCATAPVEAPEARERPTPAPAAATPAPAAATPAPAAATPAPAASPAPSATPGAIAPVATATPMPSAAPTAVRGVQTLPSTSTLAQTGPAALVGLLLVFVGALILRSRRSTPTIR